MPASPSPHAAVETTRSSADPAGRVVAVSGPATAPIGYDAAGQLASVTPAVGGTVTYHYGSDGRRVEQDSTSRDAADEPHVVC